MTYDTIISALCGSRAQEPGRNDALTQVGAQLLALFQSLTTQLQVVHKEQQHSATCTCWCGVSNLLIIEYAIFSSILYLYPLPAQSFTHSRGTVGKTRNR